MEPTIASDKVSRLPYFSCEDIHQRYERGVSQRQAIPWSSHAAWSSPAGRDAVALLEASNQGRVERLVPIRHHRMLASPFSFFRGAPAVMAYDLAQSPTSGITVQLCGDCHIGNFGLFASPERSLVFDLNDFDETLPGPFEWDIKRLAASIVVAARNAKLSDREAETSVRNTLRSYHVRIQEFKSLGHVETFYNYTHSKELFEFVKRKHRKKAKRRFAHIQKKDRLHALAKLTIEIDGVRQIKHDPPWIIRLGKEEDSVRTWLTELFTIYYHSLPENRKHLLSRYRLVDVAHKVVGVGSVGTRCFISYWEGNGTGDPLFLQIKQASASILEPYLGRSEYDRPGQRIVTGQRMMQATNDIFLSYTHAAEHDYFVRQLYDMKGSSDLDHIPAIYLKRYAAICGAVLARAHARSGDAAQIAGYLGESDAFEKAMVEFAFRYNDQNDKDYMVFKQAIQDGRLPILSGEE